MIAPVWIDGSAWWTPSWPDWETAAAALRGQAVAAQPVQKRPSPTILPPAERRRAPDSVALALEVASRAVQASGLDAGTLPCVFTSAHGDLALSDYMCSTLATAPTTLSPTKFHNSVHNAPAGYWTIASRCMATSQAVTAFTRSFAAGLLEAITQCVADDTPVLLVGCDIESVGALASVTRSEGLLAVALVLSPVAGLRSVARMDMQLTPGSAARPVLRSAAAQALAGNAMADALPLFELLAHGDGGALCLPLSAGLGLALSITTKGTS
jgi:Beta-ketoacyl synthase, N-terminal domain